MIKCDEYYFYSIQESIGCEGTFFGREGGSLLTCTSALQQSPGVESTFCHSPAEFCEIFEWND